MIRWGFLGCGLVAHDVAEDFALVGEATIHAVAARRIESARAFSQRFGVPVVHDSLDALLGDPDIDIVYIATPHHLHRDHCLAALRAGKPTLCEKPFTTDAASAAEVIDAAREQGLFCMEAMWTRFFPAIRRIKALTGAGELGELQWLSADFGYPTWRDPASRFFDPSQAGGALLDRGVYALSLAQHLLGEPEAIATLATHGETGVDEQSACLLRFPNGALAQLGATLNGLTGNTAILTGTKGRLQILEPFYRPERFAIEYASAAEPAGRGGGSRLARHPALKKLRRRLAPVLKARLRGQRYTHRWPGNGYQFEIAEACRCLREELTESPVMPLADTLAVMRMIDTIRSHWEH